MKTKLKGNLLKTNILPPKVGEKAPNFKLVKSDLSEAALKDYKGKKVILNIFPSIDTGVCAASVKKFNKEAARMKNTVVLCISMDLPFAQSRFCGAEGIKNVEVLSGFRSSFGKDYGVLLNDSPLKGVFARAVVVVDEKGKVVYNQVVEEITTEPNYTPVLNSVK